MPSISPSASIDTADHDDGLSHDHHWAREVGGDRFAYPMVEDAARIGTPSSAMHDDAHYAF